MLSKILTATALTAAAFGRHLSEEEIAQHYPNPAPLPPASELNYKKFGVDASYTLREAAKAAGIYVGAAVNHNYITTGAQKEQYRQVFTTEYDLATAENSCKFGPTEPNEGSYTYDGCDQIFNVSTAKGADSADGVFRLHNMVWGVYNPKWLTGGGFSPSKLQAILEDHVTKVVSRYDAQDRHAGGGKVVAVDVVNEAIADGGAFKPGQSIFKKADPWYPALDDYVYLAFQTASSTTKQIPLFYNDYSAEEVNAKSDRVYKMVQGFKDKGVRVDGVGLQCHFTTSHYPNFTSVGENIKRLGALGLKVHITELDVSVQEQTKEEFEKQAMIYGQLLEAALQAGTDVFRSYETWGFTSLVSWRGETASALPFDEKFQKKPAYYEILATLQKHARGGA